MEEHLEKKGIIRISKEVELFKYPLRYGAGQYFNIIRKNSFER